jgi:hypothetical protein
VFQIHNAVFTQPVLKHNDSVTFTAANYKEQPARCKVLSAMVLI